ncbi:hypothetical protein SERLA73DRAFT_162418 [Serpula lacrymans var. lacrymans S7.3]|uniref:DUF6593 domain-containing protein n=2 Tax=Serpula lacrymans var. lacrymans TaxID=341189 RepID=F8Q7R9_SERL3|nr:hypothetical protein SERLA73DRAFT_162418 [Serpula lacrymans var. lacrymans S7.3]
MQESNSQKYIFAGPDGRPYKWRFRDVISLELNDSSKTPIARYHRRSLGILGKRHDPYLEIFPVGEHMVDVIATTFIYLEKLRRVEERAARRRGNNARFAAQNTQFAAQSAAQASSAATATFMATGI